MKFGDGLSRRLMKDGSKVQEDIIFSDQGEWHRKEEERGYNVM